jgi:hypothetical protein
MESPSIVLPPNITINVISSRRGKTTVAIVSDADISQLVNHWNIETTMETFQPYEAKQLDNRTVILTFTAFVWRNMCLSDYYDGNFLGTNLVSYLETKNTPMVMPYVISDDTTIVMIATCAFAVGLLAMGITAVSETK